MYPDQSGHPSFQLLLIQMAFRAESKRFTGANEIARRKIQCCAIIVERLANPVGVGLDGSRLDVDASHQLWQVDGNRSY